ncbi:ribonuclease J [Priestia flexa]|uniref:ribonuclease J n=1 Tax=Priestia flexa TaxID=86664 RepID=UPI00203AC088|nr:ribonuclease J [Priestia flexa]MCM3065630.1 ribonuclease J [Priestia flexa]
MDKKTENIKISALGGIGEIGKNMYIVEVNDDIYVLDAGAKVPGGDMLGIDMVIPDISYLIENKERVKAIFLTHGHEEQIGAIPFISKKIEVPVYGTEFTLALVKERMKEVGLNSFSLLNVISSSTRLSFENVSVSFFRTNHSIPDSVGICLHTSHGVIVHTGDFIFDQNRLSKKPDIGKMAMIGEQGVLCLLSDSINAEKPGYTTSEAVIGQEVASLFHHTKGRIIVATYSSNIQRIQQVIQAVYETNRKLVVVGKSMMKTIEIAVELGHLSIPEDLIVPVQKLRDISEHETVVLTTGHQGEPMAALHRMAKQSHKFIQVKKDDTVLIAATPIPGHEVIFAKVIDIISRLGANVVHSQKQVHASGHGSQEELKFMLNLMNPKYLIPVNGEYRMQKSHEKIAKEIGLGDDEIFVLDKGEVIEYKDGRMQPSGRIYAGNTLIDGLGVGDIGNIVLRDRRLLSQDGILTVVVTINKKQRTVVAGPEIISRGFVYVRESEALLTEAGKVVEEILAKCMEEKVIEWSSLKLKMREALNQFLYEKTRRKPMILPIIMEI